MVETITPVVHGGRRSRYRRSVALHTLGATLAAGLLGIALGAAGVALRAPWGSVGWLVVCLVALAYALRELAGVPIPIPDRRRQVPAWWRTFYSPPVAALLYGAALGAGFPTFLSFGTFVAVAAGALASGSPLVGLLLCAPFGLARGLSIAVAGDAEGAEEAGAVVDRLEAIDATRVPRAVNGVALLGVAAAIAQTLV
ncbi:MAG: hypothetical protein ABR529_01020 [Actinomycetota bacterium]